MMTNTKVKLIVAAMGMMTLAAGLGTAIAATETEGTDGPKEKAAIAAAKVTLQQAIATAEQQVGGKATANGIENQDDANIYYNITVDKGGSPQKVVVDMQTGKVVNVAVETNNETDKKD